MNKLFSILASLITLNIFFSCWLFYTYKNSPPVEENIRVRVGQSDRFIAENANKIEQMRGEIKKLEMEIAKLNEGMAHHSQMLQDHERRIKQ